MIRKRFVFFMVVFLPFFSFASIHETLPSWHWAYRFIDDLRLRGCFEELYTLNRPYTRGEVASSLLKIEEKLESKELRLSNSGNKRIRRLMEEFRYERDQLLEKGKVGNQLSIGGRLQGNVGRSAEGDAKYRGIYRSQLSVPLGSHVVAYNGINFDQYLVDDPAYIGKKWRGIVGYTEQAYIAVGTENFRFKFGRDFLRWGAGESGTLLFSDIARPMDQFAVSAQIGHFRYSFFTSALDDMTLDSSLADSLGGSEAKRYISAHRLDARFFQGRLQCAVTEVVLYGGVNRLLDWVYLNPFIFYHGEQLNKSGPANTFGSLDVSFFPVKCWEVYGSLLIDDIQIEKTGPGDLEPNEIGWLLGSRWADPVGISGLTVSGEYVRVANRTYKTPNSWETFIHRNVPLGHPLGNDFDFWQIGASQWVGGALWIKLGYSQTRRGEGSLFTPFDTPWMEHTTEEGYSEPFPTGVVEKLGQLSFSLQYYPSIHWGLEAEVHYLQMKNADHIVDVTKNTTEWRIGVWVEGERILKF